MQPPDTHGEKGTTRIKEAVDTALRHLQLPAGSPVPEDELRCQVIAATGSRKTHIATVTSQHLHARRVLVLVPGPIPHPAPGRRTRPGCPCCTLGPPLSPGLGAGIQ